MDFDPLCQFLYFCSQWVVAVVTIDHDSNKTRKSLAGLKFRVPMLLKGAVTKYTKFGTEN